MGLLLAGCTGCGGANGSGSASTGTTTTSTGTTGTTSTGTGGGNTGTTSSAPAGYTLLTQPWVSFAYPTGWAVTVGTSTTTPTVNVQDPANPTESRIFVGFLPNYPNLQTVQGGQCASADQALYDLYSSSFATLATDPSKYPRTTVTWQDPPAAGGKFGGASANVSVSYQVSVPSSVNYVVHLEAVPRTGGLYITAFWGWERYYTSPVAITFDSNINFVYPFLPKGSNCSALN